MVVTIGLQSALTDRGTLLDAMDKDASTQYYSICDFLQSTAFVKCNLTAYLSELEGNSIGPILRFRREPFSLFNDLEDLLIGLAGRLTIRNSYHLPNRAVINTC